MFQLISWCHLNVRNCKMSYIQMNPDFFGPEFRFQLCCCFQRSSFDRRSRSDSSNREFWRRNEGRKISGDKDEVLENHDADTVASQVIGIGNYSKSDRTAGIQLSAIWLLEIYIHWTFTSSLTEWSDFRDICGSRRTRFRFFVNKLLNK